MHFLHSFASVSSGTDLSPSNLQMAQEYCKSKGLPVVTQVLLPRPRGLEMAINTCLEIGLLDVKYDCKFL